MAKAYYPLDTPVPAAPPELGLVQSAFTPAITARWEDGFTFRPDHCGDYTYWWDCFLSGGAAPTGGKPAPTNPGFVQHIPVAVVVSEKCEPGGSEEFWSDMQGRLDRRLRASESHAIEREFWTGAQATTAAFPNNYLARNGTVTALNGSTAMGYITALAEIEQALGDCSHGGQHMIHASRRTITYWESMYLVHRDGNRLVTEMGTSVVAGQGYTGSAPTAPGTPGTKGAAWVYGTGLVSVLRGPIVPIGNARSEVLDRDTNLVTLRAERKFAAVWDGCCHVGAHVDHTTAA